MRKSSPVVILGLLAAFGAFFLVLSTFKRKSHSLRHGGDGADLSPRIVGGEVADPGRYEYYAYLRLSRGKKRFRCGGSLIYNDIILTCAHCLFDGKKPMDSIQVWVNYTHGEVGSYVLDVDGYLSHPRFDPITGANDIALLRLATPVDNIQPVNFNTYQEVPTDFQDLSVFGLGRIGESGPLSEELMEASVSAIPNDVCNGREMYDGRIDNVTMLCAGGDGRDSCDGDSGSPLIVKSVLKRFDLQVGIVSWGGDCGKENRPGVYTRVSMYKDWIFENLCTIASSPPLFCVLPWDAIIAAMAQIRNDTNNSDEANIFNRTSSEATSAPTMAPVAPTMAPVFRLIGEPYTLP